MLLSLVSPGCLLGLVVAVGGLVAAFRLIWVGATIVLAAALALRIWLWLTLPRKQERTIAFFHPYANGGGGGERVLWCAVAAVQEAWPQREVVIYSGDGLTAEQLASNALSSFSIALPRSFQVGQLRQRELLDPTRYPSWTLVWQAVGSVRLAFEALRLCVPEVFVDTSGWAFTYPLARLAGVRVAAYTHYPTVSANMLARVQAGAPTYNNSADIAGSGLRSAAKLVYYYLFATAYGAAGGCAQASMANSGWTMEHVAQLFWGRRPPARVWPPCDTAELAALPLQRKLKRLYLVSLAQFRPEKDHGLQLSAFARARRRALAFSSTSTTSTAVLSARLKLIGSCRNAGDQERVKSLRQLAAELGISEHVDFCVNAPWDEVKLLLGGAVGGLHTMVDEHFGISIVQYMAAGVIPVVNDSGGPREDILTTLHTIDGFLQPRRAGYLCSTEAEYAEAMTEVLAMDDGVRRQIAGAARQASGRFSDAAFKAAFLDALAPAMPSLQ